MTKLKSLFKYLSFGLLVFLVVYMMGATALEQYISTHKDYADSLVHRWGTSSVHDLLYASPFAVCVWTLMTVSALVWLWQRKVQHHPSAMALHLSLVLILVGALVTHCFGQQGKVHLRQGEAAATAFVSQRGDTIALPFALVLDTFQLETYAGTFSPMDYVSRVRYLDEGKAVGSDRISMNHIGHHRSYRFYQSGYDADGKGAHLAVAYDPYGIGITYAGYAALLFSMFAFLFSKQGGFRRLLRHPALRRQLPLLLLFLLPLTSGAAERPRTLSKTSAEAFGNLYVYYHDRICPMQTLAVDFTTKLCGKSSYRGLTAEQVLSGWFFFYDEWKEEPMIKIDDAATAHLLGVEGDFAALVDFVNRDGYKLEAALQESGLHPGVDKANEKFNLVSMVSTGSLLRIYPYCMKGASESIWYSFADNLPQEIPSDKWLFMRNSMGYVAEKVEMGKDEDIVYLLGKIRKYQSKEAVNLPSEQVFKAEKLYNHAHNNKAMAIACVTLGLLSFFFYCRRMAAGKGNFRRQWLLVVPMAFVVLYLSLQLFLRGYVSGHLPLSDGFETMLFLSWCSGLLTLCFYRRFSMALPFGFLLCGLSLMVAMIGEQSPQITQLMPVLKSPLLSIHVVVIMIAYALLGFVMLNGVTALFLHYGKHDHHEQVEYLAIVSRLLLYPAVFLLTIGVFVGAVWANVSWGRYWGWDPKETWALITMLIYAFALHSASLGRFRRPVFFHWFCVLAFASVLFTYLGVNFFLGGMHSYA